jgi:AcrR family transcriptional regulator
MDSGSKATASSEGSRAGKAAGRRELKKSSLTRQKILDAAASIFAERGYGRTLMSDIAEAAGVHITVLYYHFSTKDDLAEAMINHAALKNRDLLGSRVEALPADAPFTERFRAAVHAQLEGAVAHRAYVLAQSKVLSELSADRQERHRTLLRAYSEFWRELLQEGVSAGAVRADLDPSILRMILQGSLNWTVEWYRPGGRSLPDIADQIAETMLHGIVAAPR